MNDWKRWAKDLMDKGHQRNVQWEIMLKNHLRRCFPDLLAELQAERIVAPYLIVKTASAMELANRLMDQGTPPDTARSLALEELLPVPPEEQDRPAEWELEGAQESMIEAARQVLLRPSAPSPQALKTQPT
jgi:hypothetical protein